MREASNFEQDLCAELRVLFCGATVTNIRYQTNDEAGAEYWESRAMVVELSNGCRLYASQDDEGNGPGAMFFDYLSGTNGTEHGLAPVLPQRLLPQGLQKSCTA